MDLERLAEPPRPVDEDAVLAEIAAYLHDDLPSDQAREPWRITNIGEADWAMRVVAEARRRQQDYDDQIRLWQDAKRRMGGSADWLEDRLAEWALEVRTDRVKSQALAHGTVATRRSPPKIEVVAEDAVIEWAKSHAPQAVRIECRFLKSEVGDSWAIRDVVVGFRAIERVTGEVEEIPLEPPIVDRDEAIDRLLAIQSRMTGYNVTSIVGSAVMDSGGGLVPGVEVVPEHIAATVRPLMP